MKKLNNIFAAALVALSLQSYAGNCPALSGDITVGKSEMADFSTLTEALEVLKCGGVSGPLNIVLEDGTYEERVVISSIPGVSAFNPVTITSASGENADVVIKYAKSDAAMVINSSFISLENITVDHKGTYGNCVRVEGKSNNIHFKNVVFEGVEQAANGISNATVYFTADAPKSDIRIEDCEVNNGSMGIWKGGMSESTPDTKTTIEGTLFFGQTEAGIALVNEDAPVINSNVISSTINGANFKAVSLENVANRMIVNRNIISVGRGGVGVEMNNCVAEKDAQGQVTNNNVTINGNSEALGIFVAGNTDNQLFNFNRVKMAMNPEMSAEQGYYKNTASGSNLNMLNNIFVDINTGAYTIIGNSYKDFFNQLPAQSNQELSASANSLSIEKTESAK